MDPEIKFELSEIQNIEKVIQDQVVKFQNLRDLVKDLEFIPVESIGTYSSVTYKSIDGGKMGISFYPFELDYIVISDSYGNELIKFLVPKGADLSPIDFSYMNDFHEIKTLLKLLGLNSITESSGILKNSKIAMEIAEYASIFTKLTKEKNEPLIIMKDGLLRTKSLKRENIEKLLTILKDFKRRKLIGVSKSSKVLNLISSALFIENKIPDNTTGYIEIPWEIEKIAYKQMTKERLYQAFGKLYVAKLSKLSNLLVTVEIPFDLKNNEEIYSRRDTNEIFGHLIKDSMGSYPILGYPQTIMRAHEKAVRKGFTASIWSEKIIDKILENLGSQRLKKLIIEGNFLREYVKKGVLGGT